MSCPRCHLSRGVDPGGLCRCCGFYAVEIPVDPNREQKGVIALPTGGNPVTGAKSTLECPDLPPSELELRGLWCWWW